MLSFALNSEGLTYRFEKVACNLDLPSGADTIQEGQTPELEGFLRETAQKLNSLWGSLPEGGGGPAGQGAANCLFRRRGSVASSVQRLQKDTFSHPGTKLTWSQQNLRQKKKKKTRLEMWERLQGGFTEKKKKRKVASLVNPLSPAVFCALGKDPSSPVTS